MDFFCYLRPYWRNILSYCFVRSLNKQICYVLDYFVYCRPFRSCIFFYIPCTAGPTYRPYNKRLQANNNTTRALPCLLYVLVCDHSNIYILTSHPVGLFGRSATATAWHYEQRTNKIDKVLTHNFEYGKVHSVGHTTCQAANNGILLLAAEVAAAFYRSSYRLTCGTLVTSVNPCQRRINEV